MLMVREWPSLLAPRDTDARVNVSWAAQANADDAGADAGAAGLEAQREVDVNYHAERQRILDEISKVGRRAARGYGYFFRARFPLGCEG